MTLLIDTLEDQSRNLTKFSSQSAVLKTHIGQAHIAGSGPKDTTCRTCVFWGQHNKVGYKYSGIEGSEKLHLQGEFCDKPILNKARRLVPHDAPSCQFFDHNEHAPQETRDRKRKKKTQAIANGLLSSKSESIGDAE